MTGIMKSGHWFLGMVISCLCVSSCGKDADGFLPDVSVKELAITTHVNGYLPEGAEAGSRASSSGNTFNFTSGDAIGLIALKNGSVMSEYNNVKLTYSGGGWRSSEPLYDFGATSYIAYYPYRSDMSGKTSVDAIKSAFPIQTDQSTEANFNASNLLTATATPNGESLRFNFTPAFAMVEVTVPEASELKGYSNANGEKFTYKIYGSKSATYTSATSFYKKDKILRKIIKASTTTEIKVIYNIGNIPFVTYTKNVNIGQGNYKKLVLDGTINHNLEAGDCVYNDGGDIAFFPGKCSSVPTENCVGVVYWVGDIVGENYGLLKTKSGTTFSRTHGLVASLWDMAAPERSDGRTTMTWTYGDKVTVIKDQLSTAGFSVPSGYDLHAINNMQGYVNTLALEKYNTYVGSSGNKRVKPIEGLSNFQSAHPAPASSSGWYCPSICELRYMYWGQGNSSGKAGKDMLNKQFTKAGGTSFNSGTYYEYDYWSSTEINDKQAYFVNFNDGSMNVYGHKYNTALSVRPLFAF